MARRRMTLALLILVFIAAIVTLNFSMILILRHQQQAVPFSEKDVTLSASSCVRPQDTAQGLDSIFTRDPAFWGRRPRLVQALRDYAELHKRALLGGGERVVLSHSWGGMNNRFLPLASALLFGMMTGR
jgi:hypothetical protein